MRESGVIVQWSKRNFVCLIHFNVHEHTSRWNDFGWGRLVSVGVINDAVVEVNCIFSSIKVKYECWCSHKANWMTTYCFRRIFWSGIISSLLLFVQISSLWAVFLRTSSSKQNMNRRNEKKICKNLFTVERNQFLWSAIAEDESKIWNSCIRLKVSSHIPYIQVDLIATLVIGTLHFLLANKKLISHFLNSILFFVHYMPQKWLGLPRSERYLTQSNVSFSFLVATKMLAIFGHFPLI